MIDIRHQGAVGMRHKFHPYINHTVTVWPGGKKHWRGLACIDLWRGDFQWPASFQVTYRRRGVVYWHIWFFGLTRYKRKAGLND